PSGVLGVPYPVTRPSRLVAAALPLGRRVRTRYDAAEPGLGDVDLVRLGDLVGQGECVLALATGGRDDQALLGELGDFRVLQRRGHLVEDLRVGTLDPHLRENRDQAAVLRPEDRGVVAGVERTD